MTMPATYQEARAIYDRLNADQDAASKALCALPGISSGPMGLTPDSVKASPEFRRLRAAYDRATDALRRFNRDYQKRFRAEIRAERRARDAARMAAFRADA